MHRQVRGIGYEATMGNGSEQIFRRQSDAGRINKFREMQKHQSRGDSRAVNDQIAELRTSPRYEELKNFRYQGKKEQKAQYSSA